MTARGGCRGNAAPGSARALLRSPAVPLPRSAPGSSSLSAPAANVFIKPKPTPGHFLLLQNIQLWQIIKKIERSSTAAYFPIVKIFFFTWIPELLGIVTCPSLPRLQSHSLLLLQCPAPLSCLQDTSDVRKGRVCAPGAELFLFQLSQLRESSPGKGHKLGLHVQPVPKPQFILINIISAAVKLDKII